MRASNLTIELAPLLLKREQTFLPVDDKLVPLRYGKTYEFRVRLADLTRGGPPSSDDTPLVPHASSTINFQRRTRPAQIIVVQRPQAGNASLTIAKPRLGYPDALFAGVPFKNLKTDVALASDQKREISVADPDVLKVEIAVEARALEGDVALFLPLYTTTRDFDAEEIKLDLELADFATLDLLGAIQPENGALVIPTARDIRITLVGLGKDGPVVSAPADQGTRPTRAGGAVTVELRAAAQIEAVVCASGRSIAQLLFPATSG